MTATVHGPEQGALAFDDGAPHHDADRVLILAAIRRAALDNDGIVDPGVVRRGLTGAHGLVVHARALSGAYSWLARRGVLTFHAWGVSDDYAGGNAGKPARLWRCDLDALAEAGL